MKPQLTFDDLSSDNPNVTPEYMLAVMEGHIKHGLLVNSMFGKKAQQWTDISIPGTTWDWGSWIYRLPPSCRAAWEAAYLTKTAAPERPFAVGDWVFTSTGVARIKGFVSIEPRGLSLCQLDDRGNLTSLASLRHATPAEIAAHLGAQLAPGHNPHRLTNWHVCPEMGWRLLDRDEVKPRGESVGAHWVRDPDYIECWHQDTPPLGWHRIGSGTGWDISTYRTRLSRAELAVLDANSQPIQFTTFKDSDLAFGGLKTVPLTMEDLPGGAFWVAPLPGKGCPGTEGASWLVTKLDPQGLTLGTAAGTKIDWSSAKDLYQYSTDRQTWHPFSKQVPA